MNKKGNGYMVLLIVSMLMISVSVFVLFLTSSINNQIMGSIGDSGFVEEGSAADEIVDQSSSNMQSFDLLLFFIWVGLWIFGLVISFMVDLHPALFGLMIILFLFLAMLPMFLEYILGVFLENVAFDSIRGDFPLTSFFVDNLLVYYLLYLGSYIGIYFARSRLT